MKELNDIIIERDDKFKKSTIEIFLAMDLSIECVEEFLSSVEPMFLAGEFSWNDVFMEEQLVTILGVVSFDPGTVIETKEGTVNITADNMEYFQRVVRMVLPYELVSTGKKPEILKFLKELQSAGKGEDYGELVKNAPADSHGSDFDLTELTKDQQASLLLYNTNKQTNN